jgi:hypothetical protein
MDENDDVVVDQASSLDDDQMTATFGWPGHSEDAQPADDQEPPQDAEATSETAEEAEVTPETAEDAEATPEPESAEDAEATAEEESTAEDDAVQEPEEATDDAEPAATLEEPEPAGDLTAEHLIDPDDAEKLQNGWRDVKAAFVDDPPDAVRQASILVGEAVDGLTTALTSLRESLDGRSRDVDDTDTERLRLVLRGYGSLLDHILTR